MTIVAQEQAEEVQRREARRLQARKLQAQAALQHSKLRQLRAHRLSGLKVGALLRAPLPAIETSVAGRQLAPGCTGAFPALQ